MKTITFILLLSLIPSLVLYMILFSSMRENQLQNQPGVNLALTPYQVAPYSPRTMKYFQTVGCNSGHKSSATHIMKTAGLLPVEKWADAYFTCRRHENTFKFKNLGHGQTINAFPNAGDQIREKPHFCKNCKEYWGETKMIDFTFPCFILPNDWTKFKEYEKLHPEKVFVVKPYDKFGGSGISLKMARDIKNGTSFVQECLMNPYLIEGRKFDIRLVALVTSVSPLRIYIHQKGILRFSSLKFSNKSDSLSNKPMHITNISYQERLKPYGIPKSSDDRNSTNIKTLEILMDDINHRHGSKSAKKVWRKMKEAVTKTFMTVRHKMMKPSCPGCYQIFGADLILTENLVPLCIEMNTSPSLYRSSAISGQSLLVESYSSALKMKGSHPNVWPLSIPSLEKKLAEFANSKIVFSSEQEFETLGLMLTEFYYRESFDLAWPSISGDSDLMHHFSTKEQLLYKQFVRLVESEDISALFPIHRPEFFDT